MKHIQPGSKYNSYNFWKYTYASAAELCQGRARDGTSPVAAYVADSNIQDPAEQVDISYILFPSNI